jgi:CubicO group peptidase (beta-lactamase class C family)
MDPALLTRLDQPVLDFFPAYTAWERETRKRAVTLRHLLSLQSGFSREMPHEYWRDPVRLALERPMERQPGGQFFYDSPAVDILSGVLTQVTGTSAAAFADASLFKTLGIWRDPSARFTWQRTPHGTHTWHGDAFWDEQEGYLWKVDPQGHSTGSFGAHLTAREMAKLGYLHLNRGMWDGQQVVSPAYAMDSTRQQSSGGPPVGTHYGYLWWITRHGDFAAFFASGFGGKLIYVIPDLDLVIVTAASTEMAFKHVEQWEEIMALIPRFVLPAVRTAEVPG